MFSSTIAVMALAAAGVSALENTVGTALGINPDSMISYDRIYLGYAPNYNPQVTMAKLNADSGQKGATYNVYSQLNSDNAGSQSYNGNDQYNVDDIISSGAVLIASLMPEIQWTDVKSGLCESVNDYFTNTFTDKGTTVWLRFAHEMNYYSTDGTYPGGQNYDEFKAAWQCMYDATKSNDKILMFWSPNQGSVSDIQNWLPDPSTIDIVGIDVYPVVADEGVPSFDSVYGDFYNAFAKTYNKPFAIGETGIWYDSNTSASIADRQAWLKNILLQSESYGNYPLYTSATWFEYGPPSNKYTFYIVYDQSSETVMQTVSNTENGSA